MTHTTCLPNSTSLLEHADDRDVHGNRSLAWLGLETLPDCISNFTHLQSLTLDGNKLTSLPVLNARSLETLFANSTHANTNTGNNIWPITGAWRTTSLKHSKLAALSSRSRHCLSPQQKSNSCSMTEKTKQPDNNRNLTYNELEQFPDLTNMTKLKSLFVL